MRRFPEYPILPHNCLAVCLLAVLAGSGAVDLRTPSLQAAAASESELSPGDRAIDLYAPSLPDAVSAGLELPQGRPVVDRAVALYAPSLQSLGSPKLTPKRRLRGGGCDHRPVRAVVGGSGFA